MTYRPTFKILPFEWQLFHEICTMANSPAPSVTKLCVSLLLTNCRNWHAIMPLQKSMYWSKNKTMPPPPPPTLSLSVCTDHQRKPVQDTVLLLHFAIDKICPYDLNLLKTEGGGDDIGTLNIQLSVSPPGQWGGSCRRVLLTSKAKETLSISSKSLTNFF